MWLFKFFAIIMKLEIQDQFQDNVTQYLLLHLLFLPLDIQRYLLEIKTAELKSHVLHY